MEVRSHQPLSARVRVTVNLTVASRKLEGSHKIVHLHSFLGSIVRSLGSIYHGRDFTLEFGVLKSFLFFEGEKVN